tara:strand:- start:545 stop:1372 length:828 start_codon:yes stop_codon:yes gene_type:complete
MTNLDDIKAWLASGPIIDCARQLSVEVDLGRPPKSITFAGTNAVVTSTKEGIWATGGVFRYPASVGSQLEFVFTGEDYSEGTGMQWLRLIAETATGDRIVEDIRASTAAAVTTTATDITDIIEWYGVSFGSLGHAENAVTMQIEGGGTVLDTLSAGTDAPHSARLYVPAEHIGVLPWWATSITATATSTPPADMWLAHDWDFARGEHRGAAIAVDWQSVTETGWTTTEPAVPFLVPAGTRIEINGIRAGADDAVVKAKAEVLLYSEPEHQANQCQ